MSINLRVKKCFHFHYSLFKSIICLPSKASDTNIRACYTEWEVGNFSITLRHSQCVSVSFSLSKHCRGWGRPVCGDMWRRQTEAAGEKQTETKPAVRGSDSGGGEGGKTSKQHCVGDGNCGLADHCLYQTWLEWYDVFWACLKLFNVQTAGFSSHQGLFKPVIVLKAV